MCWLMALLAELKLSYKCSLALVTKWRVDIPIFVVFTSHEHVSLYTTLHFKPAEVLDFRLKYDPVLSEQRGVTSKNSNIKCLL